MPPSRGLAAQLVPLEELKEAVKDAAQSLGFPFLSSLYDGLRSLFRALDFVTFIGLDWNCGGALSMFAPIAYLFGNVFLSLMIGTDVILISGLTMRGKAQSSKIRKKIAEQASKMSTSFILAALQSIVVILTQVAGSVFTVERTCSDFDNSIKTLSQVFCIIVIIIFFYALVSLFSERQTLVAKASRSERGNYCHTYVGLWLQGVFRLVLMAAGLWTVDQVDHFKIVQKAQEFDNDPTDTDNMQQDTISLIAKSRALVFLPIPGGILVTKLAEAANSPALFVTSNVKALKLKDSKFKRGASWLLSMLRYVFMVMAVFGGDVAALVLMLLASVGEYLMEILVPEEGKSFAEHINALWNLI